MTVFKKIDRFMNFLYLLFGILGGVLIVLISVAVVLSIFSRMFGFYVPGIVETSGYMLAGSGALGLSYTFQQNGHIRVLMLVERFRGRTRYFFEVWGLLSSTAIMGYLAYFLGKMVYISWLFEEVSDGSDEMHMWIPQSIMAFGFILFSICLFHSFIKAIFTQHLETTNESIDFRKTAKGCK